MTGPKALPKGSQVRKAAPMALVALNKKTGKVRWTTPRNMGRGFSTPRLMTMAGGRIDLVLNGPLGVWGYDPRTGKERWRCERSDRQGAVALRRTDAGLQRRNAVRPVGPARSLPGHSPARQRRRDHAAMSSGRSVARAIAMSPRRSCGTAEFTQADSRAEKLRLLRPEDRQELYHERSGGKSLSSPIAVRGKLLFVLDDGVTLVVEPGATFQVVGRNVLGEGRQSDFGASPAVADGRLFLRSQSYLYCIGEKKN